MFYCENEFEKISEAVVLVDYSPGYKLGDFNCGIKDYNDFLINEAPIYIEQNISRVKLLIDKQSADVLHNPDTPRFYEKNGFMYNEKQNKGRSKNLSMRYDVFDD